ncbi:MULTISPECIES: AbaSI family restriction endonuclease [Morganellaceae]|uniref:AbaSI family restriction endonuclease n=2 Tax=Morganellaceae TaxID=1903414 RepID=UPI0035C829D7
MRAEVTSSAVYLLLNGINMSKDDYILRALSKISHKRWEHYIINRIFHRLNDPELEFLCQQCIRKEGHSGDLFRETWTLVELV